MVGGVVLTKAECAQALLQKFKEKIDQKTEVKFAPYSEQAQALGEQGAHVDLLIQYGLIEDDEKAPPGTLYKLNLNTILQAARKGQGPAGSMQVP